MTEKEYKELLKQLKIGSSILPEEVKELLYAKLSEYQDRMDEASGDVVEEILDALDYVEKLIKNVGGGVTLPPDKTEKKKEINKALLEEAAKNTKKGANTFTSNSGGGNTNTNTVNTNVKGTAGTQNNRAIQAAGGTAGVNTKRSLWFYSINGDVAIDTMFELGEGDLKMGDYAHALGVFDAILGNEITNAGAYMGKVLATYQLKRVEDLATCNQSGIEQDNNLKRAENCGNPNQKKYIQDLLQERRNAKVYLEAERVLSKGKDITNLKKAVELFDKLSGYRDADERAKKCREEIEAIIEADKERKRQQEERKRQEKERIKQEEERKRQEEERRKQEKYKKAEQFLELRNQDFNMRSQSSELTDAVADLREAKRLFDELKDYQDANNKKVECQSRIDDVEKIIQQQEKKEKFKHKLVRCTTIGILGSVVSCVILFALYNLFMKPIYNGLEIYWGDNLGYEEIIIDESVTTIHNDVFKGAQIKEVIIPESVVTIEGGAFQDCKSLEKVTLPANLQKIGDSAFAGCSSLREINFQDNIVYIGNNAFSDCISLEKVTFGKVPEEEIYYGTGIFQNCGSLETIITSEENKHIRDDMFDNCCNLELAELERNNINTYGLRNLTQCRLYKSAIEGIPLLANDTQLKHALAGVEFKDNATYETICIPENGLFSNVVIGEENVNEQGREVTFECDYQEDVRIIHLEGTIKQLNEEEILKVNVNCRGTTIDSNMLLVQGEDGNYPAIQKLLAKKSFLVNDYHISASEEQIFVKNVNIKENENSYKVETQFEIRKPLGTLYVTGDIEDRGIRLGNADFDTKSVECISVDLEGTHYDFLRDREIEIRQIGSNHYAIIEHKGDEILLFRVDKQNAMEVIKWNSDTIECKIERDAINCRKESDELTEIPKEESILAGVWSGTYTQSDKTIVCAVTKYIVPLGYDCYVSVFDFGSLPGKSNIASGRILERVHYDADSGEIKFFGNEFIIQPGDYTFADFKGNVYESATQMRGEGKFNFEMNKIAELESLEGIL